MRVLVTGGAGFIGSHVVDRYISEGHQVAVIDDLSTGRREFVHPEARLHEVKIQSSQIEDIFREFRPEIVNHHAAHIDLRKSMDDPVMDAEINIIGTLNLLTQIKKYKTRKIIFASTGGAIYGEPGHIPASEKTNPVPLAPYGVNKLAAEHYIRIFSSVCGMEYTILRYANVYGPRQNPKGEAGVVAIFCLALMDARQPVIFGDGSKTRDYVFVGDIAQANLLALSCGSGEVLNIGRGIEVSDAEVFQSVRDAMGCKTDPRYDTIRPGEVFRIALDAELAGRVLGWSPAVDFHQGCRITAEYYRKQRQIFL